MSFRISVKNGSEPYNFRYYFYRDGTLYAEGTTNSPDKVSVSINAEGSVSPTDSGFPKGIYTFSVDATDSEGNTAHAEVNGNIAVYDIGFSVTYTAPSPKIYSIAFPSSSTYFLVSDSSTATLIYDADEGASHDIVWSSSNTQVATVSADGIINAHKCGAAWITATAMQDETIKDSMLVIVKSPYAAIIPKNVKVIEEQAYQNTAFEYVLIPTGCSKIESKAFANMTQLALISIPSSVHEISTDAFAGSNVVFLCSPGSTAASFADRHNITWFEH